MNSFHSGLALAACILVTACGGGGDGGEVAVDPEVRDYSSVFTPLPTQVSYPADNAYNEHKEKLGELLFWDPILSGEQNTSCASCHHPDFAWADGRRFSIGSDGTGLGPTRQGNQITPIHSPTVMNMAFTGLTNSTAQDFTSGGYFWDLRADTLEQQATGPILNPVEMLGYNLSPDQAFQEIVLRLNAIPEYVELFQLAFADPTPINQDNIAKALATFQRKIISPNSRFDRFLAGEVAALSQAEVIGLNKFIDGGCARCHSGPLLSDNLIHQGEAIINDVVVRTPSLRNIALTPPYMHDGSRPTLNSAIEAYEDRGDLELSIGEDDMADIEAFLRTLTNTDFYKQKPTSVPSGLAVGGDIN